MRLALASGVLLSSALAATVLVGGPMAVADPAAQQQVSAVTGQVRAAPSHLTFTVALPYDREELRRAVRQISTPGRQRFREFLALEDAAEQFGATRQSRRNLTAWARDAGMTVTFDATGLTARLRGPVATWEALYGSSVQSMPGSPAPMTTSYFFASGDALTSQIPASLATLVTAIIPVENVVTTASSARLDPPINKGTPFGPGADCLTGTIAGKPFTEVSYSPSQLHVPYGTTALHEQGLEGQGTKLAIVAIGQSFAPGVAEAAAECFDYRAPTVPVTGAYGMPDAPLETEGFAGIESNLDVQASAAVLPSAERIDFVEAAAGPSFIGALVDGFTAALTEVNPDVITLSYGLCDPALKMAGEWGWRPMTDDIFAMAGIVGTSILIASGDSGSSACLHNGIPRPGQTSAYPASSPWVTAVGGSRVVLGANNKRTKEVVWNDTTWDVDSDGAGTGGPTTYSAPWYQAAVSSKDRRIIPDIVAHASGFPGWPVAMTAAQYEDFFGVAPAGDWGMGPVGGTSAATPFSAANFALIASEQGRLGFLNPWLYSLASGAAYDKAFYDITIGTNQVAPPAGCCKATRGFDLASGLGAPAFDALAQRVR